MSDPKGGPLFLVAINEDLNHRQSGQAYLPDKWLSRTRQVYELYSMQKVSRPGDGIFEVRSLPPGDGRVYILGTQAQFRQVKNSILSHHIQESLRVQNADRLIAINWGLDLRAYNDVVNRVKMLMRIGKFDEASVCSDVADRVLKQIMAEDEPVRACRNELAAVKKLLGRVNIAIYAGSRIVRPGREVYIRPFEVMGQRYSDLRRRYILGRKDGLVAQVGELHRNAEELLKETSECH